MLSELLQDAETLYNSAKKLTNWFSFNRKQKQKLKPHKYFTNKKDLTNHKIDWWLLVYSISFNSFGECKHLKHLSTTTRDSNWVFPLIFKQNRQDESNCLAFLVDYWWRRQFNWKNVILSWKFLMDNSFRLTE